MLKGETNFCFRSVEIDIDGYVDQYIYIQFLSVIEFAA